MHEESLPILQDPCLPSLPVSAGVIKPLYHNDPKRPSRTKTPIILYMAVFWYLVSSIDDKDLYCKKLQFSLITYFIYSSECLFFLSLYDFYYQQIAAIHSTHIILFFGNAMTEQFTNMYTNLYLLIYYHPLHLKVYMNTINHNKGSQSQYMIQQLSSM